MIDKWATRRKLKMAFRFCIEDLKEKAQEKGMESYVEDFYKQGLRRRLMKALKLFSQFAGNRLFEIKQRKMAEILVNEKVQEKKNQL